MKQRGYVGILVLLVITGAALYFFMMNSPLGHGANDTKLMKALDDKKTEAARRAASSTKNIRPDLGE